jgi:nucleotide-binding universal stress UspA family protein
LTVPGVRRIVVGVHGSLGSLQALRSATDEARLRTVPLIPIIAWLPPGGDLAERRHPSPYLRKVWREAAWERLWEAFDIGLGGLPDDIEVKPLAVRGEAGPVLADLASRPDDLLVVGTGRQTRTRFLHRNVARYCLRHARCQVLAVPPSELMTELARHPFKHSHVPDLTTRDN